MGKMVIKMNSILSYLEKRGYKSVPASFYTKIKDWDDWYKISVDDWHKSHIYNGLRVVEKIIKTLGMAKTVSETWANLMMNEKVAISCGDETSDELLEDILKKNNFRVKANQLCELSMALGSGAFVEYINNNEVRIDYIRADLIYPLSWDSRGISECAFGSVLHKKDGDYIQLQLHTLNNGQYVIENCMIKHDLNGEFKEVPLPKGLAKIVQTHSDIPFFQIITPNIVNNIDLNVPLGISVYANAMDCLKEIDLTFDSLSTEIETGRRMVFMAAELFYSDEQGNRHNVMSEKETVIRLIGESESGAEHSLIHDYSPTLRINDIKSALQFQLDLLSEKCGMGTNQFEFDARGVKTATEIISEDSDLYVNLKKHEILLEHALTKMIEAIAYLAQQVGLQMNVKEIKIDFDDSIIEDTNAERQKDMQDLANGTLRAEEYRARWRNETLEEALANLPKLANMDDMP